MEFGFGLSLIRISICLRACFMLIFGVEFSRSAIAISMSVASHDMAWQALIILSVNISYDFNYFGADFSYVVLILRLNLSQLVYNIPHVTIAQH